MKVDTTKVQTEVASYIGKLLRDHFGKGPDSVYVSIAVPYITIYIRNFMSPTEKVLMAQQQEGILQITRDLVMKTLIPDIKAFIRHTVGIEIEEFYYDWGLHNRTAIFVCMGSYDNQATQPQLQQEYSGKPLIHKEIIDLSDQAEKVPDEIFSYLINPRTLMVIRKGILVPIEKQLIRQGLSEQLIIAKRALEKGLLHNNNHFESILGTKVIDIFVDWDFSLDKSIIVHILSPS